MHRSYSVLALPVWALLCGLVFLVVDEIATSPVAIHIEDYRAPGLTDEDALLAAVQEARMYGDNWWWINDSRAVILLEGGRRYDIDPSLLAQVDVPIVEHQEAAIGQFFRAIPAVKFP